MSVLTRNGAPHVDVFGPAVASIFSFWKHAADVVRDAFALRRKLLKQHNVCEW